MKKVFLILIVSVLLAACSTTASNNSGNTRQTPIAQIQVQPSQPLATPQPPVVDTSTSTSVPATATPETAVDASSVTPTSTADPSLPANLDVVDRQGYSLNGGFYIVGEMLNNTSAPMGNIKITATYYYQPKGKPLVIGTMDGTTLLDVIPAYGEAPFVIGPFRANDQQGRSGHLV